MQRVGVVLIYDVMRSYVIVNNGVVSEKCACSEVCMTLCHYTACTDNADLKMLCHLR